MSNINTIFSHALLSQAAYANLQIGRTNLPDNESALESNDDGGANMTEEQAINFALLYPEIIAHQEDTDTGFSATVFKEEGSNQGVNQGVRDLDS